MMPHQTENLRIAVDARPLQHPYTGIGRYTAIMCDQLRSLGHTTIECHAVGTPFVQQLQSQLGFIQQALNANADLFWSPRHHLPLRSKRIPTVVSIHDLVWRKAPTTMPVLRRLTEQFLMQAAFTNSDQIIAVSRATRSDILELAPELHKKVTVIHEAATITPNTFNGNVKRPLTSPYILFVGTLEPRKNLTRVLSAFQMVQANFPNLKLVVVGRTGWGGVEVPLSDRIIWKRPDEEAELAALYAGAEFIVAPSLYEGFGLQLAEALAFGKAIVTADNSSLPEVAGEAAIYVNATNTTEIANAIQQLSENLALKKQLEQASIEQSKQFSWEKACEKTLLVFRKAIQEFYSQR